MRDHVGESRAPLLGSPQHLRIALGLSPSPPKSPAQQHSPRAVSSTIFRTCAAIAGLVILNAILAGVILSAVHSFNGNSNKPVQLPAAAAPHSSPTGYSTFVHTEPNADGAIAPPATALYSFLREGGDRTASGEGTPPWWPKVFGLTESASLAENATQTQRKAPGREDAHASSDRHAGKLAEGQNKNPSAFESQPDGWQLTSDTAWIRQVDNSSWVTEVEEFYMDEDDSADNPPASPAAPTDATSANDTEPQVLAGAAAAPAPRGDPQREDAAATAPGVAHFASPPAGSNASSAAALVASAAPESDGSPGADPAALERAIGSGQFYVSEATLAWEHLAEASVDEEEDAAQQEAVIEQERAASDGSEVQAFGEVYSAGDVAGSFLESADNAIASAPAPSPEHASDPCAAALGIPKVAIMFLSRAELFHESSWALWFQHAAGQLPVSVLRTVGEDGGEGDEGCDEGRMGLARQWCSAGAQGQNVLQRQHLFSVYIHPLPDYGSFPEESIFRGREIEDRIQVSWGAHELVLAARNLLRAAFRDPLNHKFALLSESGVPLYPPTAVYTQLMAEDKSRIDSCGIGRTDPWRFSGRMGWALREHWRKSSQWFALTRAHVAVVLEDTHILDLFQRYCQNAWDNDLNRRAPHLLSWRDCFSDEHYMPSLLAYKQLGHETDCVGRLVGVDWSQGGAHPRSYSVQDVNPDMIASLRLWDDKCDDQEAIMSSVGQFVHEAELQQLGGDNMGACLQPAYNASALGYDCPLFARKFPRETSSAVYNLFRSCTTGINITNSGVCAEGAADILDQRVGNEQLTRRDLKEVSNRRMLGRQPPMSVSPRHDDLGWL